MANMPGMVTRSDLMKLAVTDADAFTAMRYLRHRENVPSLPDLEEKGRETLPGVEGALLDIYHSLWSPEPSVLVDVSEDQKYWATLLDQALKSSAYQELHAATQLSELKSVLGTVSMGESVLALIPKEDQPKLNELSQAQAKTDDLESEAQQASAEAQVAEKLAEIAKQNAQSAQSSQSGQPSKSQGGKDQMTAEQAKQIANQLVKQAADAKAKADQLQQQYDQAKANAQQLSGELLGKPGTQQAEQKLRELTRIGLQAVRDAQTKVEEVSETIESWGLDEGELTRKSIPETLGVLERMKRNESLKKFASLLGRIRKIAARKAKSKVAGEGARVTTVEIGRDLKRAQRSELVALINPALRMKALQRWVRGELRLFGQKIKQKLGYGPVIVCEDGSGSMSGDKQMWAKACTLALAYYAKIQKRTFAWIHFGAASTPLEHKVYPKGVIFASEMLTIAETFRNASGTDFEKPLRAAIETIKKEGLKKADIALITDGECEVSDKFLSELKAVKKELEINIFVILCDVGSSSYATVEKFADRIEVVSAFTDETAEKQVFAHF